MAMLPYLTTKLYSYIFRNIHMADKRDLKINIKTFTRLSAGLLFLFTLLLAFSSSSQARAQNILFLNSYHVGYKWSDEIYQGFLETLQPVTNKVALHVEYLDMKRNFSEERYQKLAESFSSKYANINIDLLIASDDAAFLFLKRYGRKLFPGVPVFFCGTNYLELEDLQDLPNFYGVTEKANIEATFSTILRLFPDTKKIYIINDMTVTGRKVHSQIEKAIDHFQNRLDFTIWDDISMPDLITNVNNIPDKSVVFYTFFFRDNTGQAFEYNQSMSLVYRQCPVPIFGAWDFNLNYGLTGGMLTSGYQQGKGVANLVLSWLNGAPFHSLPKLTSSPNHFLFDYFQMEKFNIKISDLPKDSTVINSPTTFFDRHKQVIIISGIFITLLLLVIVFLTISIIMRRRAEKELRQSEENFRSIFSNANEGLYQATAEGQFIRVNPALACMLKFSNPDELIQHITDIDNQLYTSPESRKAFLARQKDTGWAKGEHSLYCKDGSVIDVIENAHSVSDAKGKFLYYEGSITDLTEYKNFQELIAQTEKVISLGGVSAGIAHEIRSPISSIIQGIQVVQGRFFENSPTNLQCAKECGIPLDTLRQYIRKREIKELLSHIHEAGKRAGVIIDNMLSFSRKTIGDFSLESIENIVETSLELAGKDYNLKNEYHFDNILITREIEEGLPPVYCSASKIQQVLFNIFKNGAEAMGDAGTINPCFAIRLCKQDNGIRLEIEDNGPGMDQDLKQRIFDPFYTTKGRKKGTGLGLSVSYFIIKENHHGDLRVFSQPGTGSTFIIELPLEQVTAREDKPTEANQWHQPV